MMRIAVALLLAIVFVSNANAQHISDENEISTENLSANVKWLSGSWGVRLYVRGGADLDTYIQNGYDYVSGAKEILERYPTIGHVITNFTNNAHAHLFTLRTNENVDAVMGAPGSVISEEFVPSLENEQVIIDVIKVFKDAGKKVILYLNCLNIGSRSTSEGKAEWDAYVETYFEGNEHRARMNLLEGYVRRFAEIGVDGYWLDAYSLSGESAEFIQMLRDLNPNIAIAANVTKSYFENEDGSKIKVDTDGLNDDDEADYNIVKYESNDPYSDFTSGHITPLAQGAPPNSWAYEEFTIADIQRSPVSLSSDEDKLVLKHMFVPIRETWSSERSKLMFDQEQAYRFVKNITDAGGAITFSTTTDTDGTTMEDEEIVLSYVDNKMEENYTRFTPYSRPPGAYLVGEARAIAVLDQGNVWYHNNTPKISNAVISEVSTGILNTWQSTPYTQGNASPYVSKFTRSSGTEAYISFKLPEIINEPSSAVFKIRVYTASNSTLTNNNLKMVLRKDGEATTQISLTKEVQVMNEWVAYTFDMSGLTFTGENYNEIYLIFASEDTDDDANGNVYFFDAFQGQGPAQISLKFVVKDNCNQLLPDAKLTIDSESETTDNLGEANFTLLKGSYNVIISKSGYFTESHTYTFDSDSVLHVELQKSIADVEFRVEDGGNIVPSTTINLNSMVQQANTLGIATYYELSTNEDYSYTIEKAGYESVSSTFTLNRDTTINIQLSMITGANDFEGNSFRIYPNPANDYMMIETSKFMKKVNVLGVDGQLLLSQKVSGRKQKLELLKKKASIVLINVIFEDGAEITTKIYVSPISD